MGKIRTYVGADGKLHFVNSGGADSVLPFSSGADPSLVKNLGTAMFFNGSTAMTAPENITLGLYIAGSDYSPSTPGNLNSYTTLLGAGTGYANGNLTYKYGIWLIRNAPKGTTFNLGYAYNGFRSLVKIM